MSKVEILDININEAEKLLLGDDTFETLERVPFIKNLKTCDLLAVPGSGKTTALLAKLYCLSKYLPFTDGSGILVLAHTNSAVDEIEKKLKRHCPNLFEYPNFVGTIQSFVNKFLAIPYYQNKNNKNIYKIDDEIYKRSLNNVILNTYTAIIETKQLYRTPKLKWKYTYSLSLTSSSKQIIDIDTNQIIELKKPRGNTNICNYVDWSVDTKANIHANLFDIKTSLISDGILTYRDCYFLAERYITCFPSVVKCLQSRFSYVFIDEMQDLEKFQIDLIDKIFFTEQSKTIIQRIGDKNQSIYNNVKEICEWRTRAEVDPEKFKDLTLNKSMRISPIVGKLVDSFVLDRPSNYIVEGNFDIHNESIVPNDLILDGGIPPCLLLIDQNTTGVEVKNKFEELILKYNLNNTDSGKKNGFKIVAWNTEWNEERPQAIEGQQIKKRLKDYFPDYTKESHAKKDDFGSLMKYLCLFDKEKRTLESARKSILNAFIRVLSLEEIKIIKVIRGRNVIMNYTKQDLISYLKKDDGIYEKFKQKLFHWSFKLATQEAYTEVYDSIVGFINDELIKYDWEDLPNVTTNRSIEKAKEFIEQRELSIQAPENVNIENTSHIINIDICSVHSVKGQTHCATMYIDSAYERPTYESEKMISNNASNPLNKTSPLWLFPHNLTGKYAKQALKMMYVGFSRPTHLLCYVTFLESVHADIDMFEKSGWKVELIVNSDIIKS